MRIKVVYMKKKENTMQEEYDFSKMKARKNPYAKRMKKQITINIDSDVIEYFKTEASSTGIPYQTLINMYLMDCAKRRKKLRILWD